LEWQHNLQNCSSAIRHLQELHRAGASRSIFYLTGAVGIAATLLQLYNVALLDAFWPFFTVIGVQLIAAMSQFARMVLAPQQSPD
jgi:hypothetical protein